MERASDVLMTIVLIAYSAGISVEYFNGHISILKLVLLLLFPVVHYLLALCKIYSKIKAESNED